MRWLFFLLLLLLVGLQYRLWWGDGGRLELRRLEQQAEDYARENTRLRERNEELARQVLDLKTGTTVLEQRAREELGLIREDEIYIQFVEPDPGTARGPGEPAAAQPDAGVNAPSDAEPALELNSEGPTH